MAQIEALRLSKHTLLMPIGLRLVGSTGEAWIEGDDTLLWDRIEARDAQPDATMRCLWDFVALADAPARRFPSFVGRWGLLDFGKDEDATHMDREAWSYLDDWRRAADQVAKMLMTMAATEEGQLVTEDVLLDLRDGDDYEPPYPTHLLGTGAPLEKFIEADLEARLDRFHAERQAGRGLALQRRILTNLLLAWANPVDLIPSWDDKGRTLDTTATGVRQIVGAQLAAIFAAPQLDLFICSICSKPYSLERSEQRRRPRAGVRRLCGAACRKAAKQAGNRASWHRNKEEWLSKKRRRQ